MKIPPIIFVGNLALRKKMQSTAADLPPILFGLHKDTVSFTSTAKYLKKYNTLPEDIKRVLKPADAIDMFQDMESIANGARVQRRLVGQGVDSKVYENPWLKDYYLLILQEPNSDTKVIYSRQTLGDSIWSDGKDPRIQLIKRAS